MSIAVVLPTYNYGRYLLAAVEALAAQTVAPSEVVIMDDGSTDDTAEVLVRIQADRSLGLPLSVIRREHRGFAATLNEGIRSTTAPYVVHVDADDVVHPRFLEALSAALDADPQAGYAYPRMRLTGAESGIYKSHPFDPARLLFEGNYIPNIGMFRREAFEATGGYRNLPTHVDWDLWLALAKTPWTAVLVDDVLYDWYRHPGTLTLRPQRERLAVRAQILFHHRRLALRHAGAMPYWTARAVWRRLGLRRGSGRMTASGWVET